MEERQFRIIFDAIEQGVLICNAESRIEYFNDSYGSFIGWSLDEVRGKKLTDIRPGAAVPRVIQTGEAVRSLYRVENGEGYFADIYPVKEKDATIGTVSIVTYVDKAQYLKDRINELEQEEEKLRFRMNLTNGTKFTFDDIVGRSMILQSTIELAKRIAAYDANVLLQGESGSGKELFAQAIHNESERRSAPFVAINCAAISKTMLESELFGYEEGSFTGAKKGGKLGLFEAAEGGTIFLDEISEMDVDLQSKLLRALQERKFRRIGGIGEVEMNVRVISACNVDIQQYIAEKKFRSDLYYRVSVAPINIPPLRERREDITELADAFMQAAGIQNKKKYRLTREAQEMIHNYTWPGNIRELRNIIEYAAMMAQDGLIGPECLPPSIHQSLGVHGLLSESKEAGIDAATSTESIPGGATGGVNFSGTLSEMVRAFEREEIRKAISRCGDTTEGKREAAEELGISLSSLYAKMANGEK